MKENFLNIIVKYKNIIYILISYLIFYFPYIFGNYAISGNDMQGIHYPSAFYLKQNILNFNFPFWTEKLYSGFPLYANGEMAYLNPIRIFGVLIFGFINVFKFEHFLMYFLGSYFLFQYLKKLEYEFIAKITTHFIYYFSFFHVVKMLHPNIIYITMLFPACVYFLLEVFAKGEKFNFKYLLLLVLFNAIGFYYGSLNAVFYSFLAQGIISIIITTEKKILYKKILTFWIIFASLFFIIILPQLFPSFMLAKAGARGEIKSFDFTEGSWTPSLLVTTFVPFAFGRPESYIGKSLSEWWLMHEFYYYIGISSWIMGILGYFTITDKKIKTIIASSLWIFVLLAFIKYSPIQNILNFGPFSIFRYWGRMWFFVMFSIALSAGSLISNNNVKFYKKDLWYILPPFIYLIFLEFRKGGIYLEKILINHLFVNRGIFKDDLFWLYLLILISTIIVSYLHIKKIFKNSKYYLFSILFLDLFIFGNILLRGSLIDSDKIININIQKILQPQSGIRTVVYHDEYVGNRPLYYNAWNIFGYAGPFEDVNYSKSLKQLGFESSRRIMNSQVTPAAIIGLGVKNIVNKDMNISKIDNQDRLFNTEVSYIKKDEGFFVININSINNLVINTKIRNYAGWTLKIDGVKSNFASNKEDLYLSFNLEPGIHEVQIKYVPIHFYYGFIISLFGCIGCYFLFRNRKFTTRFFS